MKYYIKKQMYFYLKIKYYIIYLHITRSKHHMTDTNAELRQLRISLITDLPNPIIDWFNDIWKEVSLFKTPLFYGEDGIDEIYYTNVNSEKTVFFYISERHKTLYCNNDHYWSVLERNIGNDYLSIVEITKLLMENYTKAAKFDTISDYMTNSVIDNKLKKVLAKL